MAAQTNTVNPCGAPVAPLLATTTAADGTYSITDAPGTYMLTIGPSDTSYATLHRTVTLVTAAMPLARTTLTALDSTQQAWLVDFNNKRATVSFPTSFANLTVDEYAQEMANQFILDIADGVKTYGCGSEDSYAFTYQTLPGAMYDTAADGPIGTYSYYQNMYWEYPANAAGTAVDTIGADSGWFDYEKAICPNGDWSNCMADLHTAWPYMSGSSKRNIWIGLGYSTKVDAATGLWPIDALLILDGYGNQGLDNPATIHRLAGLAPPPLRAH